MDDGKLLPRQEVQAVLAPYAQGVLGLRIHLNAGKLARWVSYWRWLPLIGMTIMLGTLTIGIGLIEQDPHFWSSKRAWDWGIGLASGAAVLFGGRWPLQVLLAQCGLLVLAWGFEPAFGLHQLAPIAADTIGWIVAISLGELVYRRRGPAVWLGTAFVVALFALVFDAPVYVAELTMGVTSLDSVPEFLAQALYNTLIRVGVPVGVGLLLRRTRQQVSDAENRAQAAAASAVRASERAAVARELHDLVAHHVASMVLRIGAAQHITRQADPAIRQVLDDVRATGLAVLDDLRKLVTVLRDQNSLGDAVLVDPADLLAELELAVERLRAAGCSIETDFDRTIVELDAVRRVAVLRIVQESLTNVLKHAGSTSTVFVAVEVDDTGGVLVDVLNHGGGQPAGRGKGHGICGMTERAELVGGSLQAGPSDGDWRVQARLPAPATHEVPA